MTVGGADDGRGHVMFLHGLGVHASSWLPWSEMFGDNGYDSTIIRWPGEVSLVEQCRAHPAAIRRTRWSQLTADVAVRLTAVPKRSILIGHGLGGLVAQALLGRGEVAAVISIAPVPTAGRFAPSNIRVKAGWIRKGFACRHSRANAGPEQFHRWYANRADRELSDRLYDRYAIPLSLRDALSGAGRIHRPRPENGARSRAPLLLLSAGSDLIVPESLVLAEELRNRRWFPDAISDYHAFPGRGHSLTIDEDWPDVANFCLDWLSSQNL